MPIFLLGILKSLNPKSIGILIAVGLVAFAAFKFNGMMSERDDLRLANANMQEEMLHDSLERAASDNAKDELAVRLKDSDETAKEIEEIEGQINASTEEEDGVVAPVLRNALAAVAGMRDDEH